MFGNLVKNVVIAKKIIKKGVDKRRTLMYTGNTFGADDKNALDMILENDTESRRTRTAIFTSRSLRETVNSK